MLPTVAIPDAEDVLKDLKPLVPAVYGALEAGVLSAREFFESKAAPIDPFHGTSQVRWEAKRYLDGAGHEISQCEYERENLSNNGLCLVFKKKYLIRIRKSYDGVLPVPGHSKVLQAFYHQLSFPFMPSGAGHYESSLLNLVILWDVTS